MAAVARAGNAVYISPSTIELRPYGAWLGIFRDTVRMVTLTFMRSSSVGVWTGPLPSREIPRRAKQHELELPPVGRVQLRAGYARKGELAFVRASSARAASRVTAPPRRLPTWKQIAATVGQVRSAPAVVALQLRSPRELGRDRDELVLRPGAVLVLATNRVVAARLHVEPSRPTGAWKGALPPNVPRARPTGGPAQVTRADLVLHYGPRTLRTITFR